MIDLSHRGRSLRAAAFLMLAGAVLTGCAEDGAVGPAATASAGAVPASAAAAPAAAPEPSIYTETLCKVRDGRVLPPPIAQRAYDCLLDKLRYATSGHRLAQAYRGWRRLDNGPFLSKVHGDRYVAVYANDTALTTLSAAPDSPIQAGVAMATPTFSIREDGTLEAGPLFLMEKMPKGFSTESGNWRYTVIGPEGDIVGVTNGHNSDEVAFCKECSRKSSDSVYLALLRGRSPGETEKRGDVVNYDASKDKIDPTAPIFDPNAPVIGNGPLPVVPPLPASPAAPTAAPIGAVGGPLPIPSVPGQAPVLDSNTPVLNPMAPVLDPTAPILDPSAPVTGAVPPGEAPPQGPVLGAGAVPAASALDPNAPVLDPMAPVGSTGKQASATPPLPIALLKPEGAGAGTPAPSTSSLNPDIPKADQSMLPVPTASPVPLPGELLNPDAPISAQPSPAKAAQRKPEQASRNATPPAPSTPLSGPLLDPDAPISAQPAISRQASKPATLPGSLNPDAPISAQPLIATGTPQASSPSGPVLNPDAPITAQTGPLPDRAASGRPALPAGDRADPSQVDLLNPDLPIVRQDISAFFR